MTVKQRFVSTAGAWVVDIDHSGDDSQTRRFYVGLNNPDAAVLAVKQAAKIDPSANVRISRRVSKRYANLLGLKPGEVRSI